MTEPLRNYEVKVRTGVKVGCFNCPGNLGRTLGIGALVGMECAVQLHGTGVPYAVREDVNVFENGKRLPDSPYSVKVEGMTPDGNCSVPCVGREAIEAADQAVTAALRNMGATTIERS